MDATKRLTGATKLAQTAKTKPKIADRNADLSAPLKIGRSFADLGDLLDVAPKVTGRGQ